MMNVIRILPEKVVSQIAAGEVIERPASVVKELLDNSVDAGSSRIDIRVEKGGKRLIRVLDNGVGMGRDDLLLSLERHATSKIGSASDLTSITTLGFRGEALPSTASVSRMAITSRPADALIGYRVRVQGGKMKSIDETGAPAGTIVEVRDLFFNVPARRKFLKSDRTEMDHIVDTVARMALPYCQIHFRLDEHERTLLNLPTSENALNRLAGLLGRDVAESMLDFRKTHGALTVNGYLAPPELSRSRGDRIFIYVNNRNIRDRLVTKAVMESYGQRLMKGRYPQAIIFLEMDPSLMDVNVHPTKQEVRFHHGHLVYQTLISTIESRLGERFHAIFDMGLERGGRAMQEAGQREPAGIPMAEPSGDYQASRAERTDDDGAIASQAHLVRERPQIIGQLKDTYILCESKEGLVLVDQHAAHERVVYEGLKKSHQRSKIETQSFLIPHKLEFSLKEARSIQRHLEQLAGFGLEMEHFGGNTFLLRSVPSALLDVAWEGFFFDLIALIEEEGDILSERAMDKFFTVAACHGAMRAGKRLSQGEMALLLEQLEGMDLPTNCPHGRPILKKFSYHEIEKMFKRVI